MLIVARGGAWYDLNIYMRCASRCQGAPDVSDSNAAFRIAKRYKELEPALRGGGHMTVFGGAIGSSCRGNLPRGVAFTDSGFRISRRKQ
jgi:hypothetical protein